MNNNQSESNNYSLAKFLFSVIQKEHEYEAARIKNLEARTGIFLAFAGVLLVFIVSNIKLTNLYSIKIITKLQILTHNILFILVLLTLISLLSAIIFFVKVISLDLYKKLSMENFTDSDLHKLKSFSEEEFIWALIVQFRDIIENNSNINNKKSEFFIKGINLVLYALVLTVLSYVLASFIILT